EERQRRGHFVPPTLQEIQGLITTRKYQNVDPLRFLNFYTSKGWMVGKNKMVSWPMSLAQANSKGWAKPVPKRETAAEQRARMEREGTL
ncbi:hypothetical protein LCGC14_3104950, partial [marine sediment metagenome]